MSRSAGLGRHNHALQTSRCVLKKRKSAVPADAAKRSGNGLRGAKIDSNDTLQEGSVSVICANESHVEDYRTLGI